MEDINKLLRKRKPKGDETGRAYICYLANVIDRLRDDTIPEYATMEQIDRIASKIEDPAEQNKYRFYVSMGYALQSWRIRQSELFNACISELNFYMQTTVTITTAEEYRNAWMCQPVILQKGKREEIISEYKYSRDEIYKALLRYYVDTDRPTVGSFSAEIKRASETPYTGSEPGPGYWETQDGRRSDRYSAEEWENIAIDILLQGHRGAGETRLDALKRLNADRRKKQLRAFYNGLEIQGYTAEEVRAQLLADIDITDESYLIGDSTHRVIENDIRAALDIPALPAAWKSYPQSLLDRMKEGEYTEEYRKVISNKLERDAPGKKEFSRRELEAYIFSLPQKVIEDLEQLALEGYFTDEVYRQQAKLGYTESEEAPRRFCLKRVSVPVLKTHIFMNDLRKVNAFNTLIDILAEVYDLPELVGTFGMDPTLLETHAELYTETLYGIYASLEGDELQATVYERMKPIDIAEARPTAEAIAMVKSELQPAGKSRVCDARIARLDLYINELCAR